jgi:hypothetical protein
VEVDGKIIAYSGDTEWTSVLIDVASGADLFICEAYFFDKAIKYHLDYQTLLGQRSKLGCRRLVLTHMNQDMLNRRPEFFRGMADPETYRNKELIQALNDAWADAFKKNPIADMPGEMTLAMRVFFLLFGLAATVGNLDMPQNVIAETALRYTGEPETVSLG